MKLSKLVFFLFISVFFTVLSVSQVGAAYFKSGESVIIKDEKSPIVNPYFFGSDIMIYAPITNDLTAAGGNILVNGPVSGGVLAAGGDITLSAPVSQSIRVAGGDIIIDGPVGQDVIVAGGDIRVTDKASIAGDLVFFGGTLRVEGAVQGTIRVNGGNVTLNNLVGKNVEGTIGSLTLGPKALIQGNLSYNAPEKADIKDGAKVVGKTTFTKDESAQHAEKSFRTLWAAGTIYKLIADILFALLLIWLLPLLLKKVLIAADTNSLKTSLWGLGLTLLIPLIGLLLLMLLWLGLTILTAYLLILFVTIGMMKVYTGWKILTLWNNRSKKVYQLDWRAGVLGPITLALIGLVPVIGWLIVFFIFLITFGALTRSLYSLLSDRHLAETKSHK